MGIRRKDLWRIGILLIGILALLFLEQGRARTREIANSATIIDLQSIEELQEAFNKDRGSPRLILLLSPSGDIISTTEPLAADVARLLNR